MVPFPLLPNYKSHVPFRHRIRLASTSTMKVFFLIGGFLLLLEWTSALAVWPVSSGPTCPRNGRVSRRWFAASTDTEESNRNNDNSKALEGEENIVIRSCEYGGTYVVVGMDNRIAQT